jgi:hypothetical protein
MSLPRHEPADSPIAGTPPVPKAVEDTGLSAEFMMDLLLRTLYLHGARTGVALTEMLCLPFSLLDDSCSPCRPDGWWSFAAPRDTDARPTYST